MSGKDITVQVIDGLIIGLIIVLFIHFFQSTPSDKFSTDNTTPLKSGVDGMYYKVHHSHKNPQMAADIMASNNATLVNFLGKLKVKYGKQPGARGDAVRNMLKKYNPDNIVENSPFDPEGDTSYTIDKGAKLALCIRSNKNGEIHDHNTLMFVLLHELSHIAVDVDGHPPVFWSTFKFILKEAVASGIYTVVDYKSAPVHYCSMLIEDNPLLDGNLDDI